MWPPFLSPLKSCFLGFSLLTIAGFSHTAFDLSAYSHSGHYRQWKECFALGVLQSSQTPSISPTLSCLPWGTRDPLPLRQGNSCHSCLLFPHKLKFSVPTMDLAESTGTIPTLRRPYSQLENEVDSKYEHNCPIKIFPIIKCTWKVSRCWHLLWEFTILDNFLG